MLNRVWLCWPLHVSLLFRNRILALIPLYTRLEERKQPNLIRRRLGTWLHWLRSFWSVLMTHTCCGPWVLRNLRTIILSSQLWTQFKQLLIEAWLCQASISNCLNCVNNCDDHSLLDFKSAVQYMKHLYITSLEYYCLIRWKWRPNFSDSPQAFWNEWKALFITTKRITSTLWGFPSQLLMSTNSYHLVLNHPQVWTTRF